MYTCCFIRLEGKYVKVPFSEIRYIEAHKNYPRIYLGQASFVALLTLKQLEHHLPQELFCRIHRSFVVSLQYVTAFDAYHVYLGDKVLPLARHYQKSLHQKLLILDGEPPLAKEKVAFPLELTSDKGGWN